MAYLGEVKSLLYLLVFKFTGRAVKEVVQSRKSCSRIVMQSLSPGVGELNPEFGKATKGKFLRGYFFFY
jgi:hypothetical protein